AGGEAEPKLGTNLLVEPAVGEVGARRLTPLRLPERAFVEDGGLLEQRVEPIASAALRVGLRRELLVLERNVEPVGEPLDRADEIEPIRLLDERDGIAADAAAEAVVRALFRQDGERRRLLLVERAEARVSAAHLPQPRPRLHE